MTDINYLTLGIILGFIIGAIWQWGRMSESNYRRRCELANLRPDHATELKERMI